MEQMLMKSADKICESLCDIIKGFGKFVEGGLGNFDTDEATKDADIIKDLSEAFKNINEGCYYQTVKEAMERGIDLDFKPMVDQKRYNRYYGNQTTAQMRMAEPQYENGQGMSMRYNPDWDMNPNWNRGPRMGYEVPDDQDWREPMRRPDRPDLRPVDPNK